MLKDRTFILDLAIEQFLYPGYKDKQLGILIIPLHELDDYSWPYTGGIQKIISSSIKI